MKHQIFFLESRQVTLKKKVKYVSFVGEAVNSAMDRYYNMLCAHNTEVFFGLDLQMSMARYQSDTQVRAHTHRDEVMRL